MADSTDKSTGAVLGWALSGVGFLATYFLTTALPTPLPWYYPVEHRWALQVTPDGLAMDFYGRLLASALGALVLGVAGTLISRALDERARGRWIVIAAGWSAALLVFVSGLYVHKLSGRLVTPAPLPPGYAPR